MEVLAILVCIVAFFLGWLFSIKKLATLDAFLRHFISLLVGAVTLLMAVAICIFMGVITPQGQNSTTLEIKKDPSATLLESVLPAHNTQPESKP